MLQSNYLMESDDETLRLDLKTDGKLVQQQALWAGLKPGMRVADLGCGPGKTTYYLSQLVDPNGEAVGVDFSEQRIQHAIHHYSKPGIRFECYDIRGSLDHLGTFDFIWVRFVLEYYRSTSFDIVKHISRILRPGGTLCLIDLDHNCLNHYGISNRIERAIHKAVSILERKADFDPYAGRKLYTYLYDLGIKDIDVMVKAHHLNFAQHRDADNYNWIKKAEIALKNSGYEFDEYPGGYEEFYEEFKRALFDPRRFTYTPVIICRGVIPKKR